jgi:predicted RNA-binding Zn ribbon-like protein
MADQGIRELPIVGGHLALDFANTVDNPLGPTRHDHLTDYEDLVVWSLRVTVASADQAGRLRRRAARRGPEAAAALRHAHELRNILNDVFGAVADGTADPASHWPRLRPYVTEASAMVTLHTGNDPYRWSWSASDDLTAPLRPVAYAAAELLVSEDLHRVKRCAGCPWLFLDGSRNHSRRWCDMADCGTVSKMRRYTARRSTARRAARDES